MRTFVAVWPDREVAQMLASLADEGVTVVRWVPEERLHVTLRFLGDVPDDTVPALVDRLHQAVGGSGPLTVELGPSTDRFGRAILHAPVSGLDDLAERVITATADVGEPVGDRPFHGHVTLARARGRRGAVPGSLAGMPVNGSWIVRSIAVVASEVGADGPRYRTVASIPLGEREVGPVLEP